QVEPLGLAALEIDRHQGARGAELGVVHETTALLSAILRQREVGGWVRRPVGAGAMMIEENSRPRTAVAEREDREIEHVAMRAAAGHRQVNETAVVEEARRDIGTGVRRELAEIARLDVERPEVEVLVDAVADRLALGRA